MIFCPSWALNWNKSIVVKVETVNFFPAKVSFSNLWTTSLDRIITVLSNDGWVG